MPTNATSRSRSSLRSTWNAPTAVRTLGLGLTLAVAAWASPASAEPPVQTASASNPAPPTDIAWSPERRQRLPLLPAHMRIEHARAVLAGGRPIWVAIRVPRAAQDRLPLLVSVVLQAKADELGLPEVSHAWMKNPPCGLFRCKAVGRAIASPTPPPRSAP